MLTWDSKASAKVLEFYDFGTMEDSGQILTFLDLHFTHPILGEKVNPTVLQTIGCLSAEHIFKSRLRRKKQFTGFEIVDKEGTCRLIIGGKHKLTKSAITSLLYSVCQYIVNYPEDKLETLSDTGIIKYDIAGAKMLMAYYFVNLVETIGLF